MHPSFIQSYAALTREGVSHDELGAQALQKAASGLRRSLKALINSPGDGSHEELLEALHWNQRLWTILQIEFASSECSLDHQLRRNLLKLGHYVDTTTFRCIAGADWSKVDSLVRLNESLAGSLFSFASAKVTAPEDTAERELSVCF